MYKIVKFGKNSNGFDFSHTTIFVDVGKKEKPVINRNYTKTIFTQCRYKKFFYNDSYGALGFYRDLKRVSRGNFLPGQTVYLIVERFGRIFVKKTKIQEIEYFGKPALLSLYRLKRYWFPNGIDQNSSFGRESIFASYNEAKAHLFKAFTE